MSDVFAVETLLFGHEFVMGLFALGEFEFLFVQVDAVSVVRFFGLAVFVREFHAKQVFEAVVIGLIEGELKGLFFNEVKGGRMEARAGLATFAIGAAFAGGGVVIDIPGDLGKVAEGLLDHTRLHSEWGFVETPEAGFGYGFAETALVERFGCLFDDPTVRFAFLKPGHDLVALLFGQALDPFEWW